MTERQQLSGVVHPTPVLGQSSEALNDDHDCAIDGHSLEVIETFGGGIVRMLCAYCPAQWRVEQL